MAMDAMLAGKDVYLEKPMSYKIEEAKVLAAVKAALGGKTPGWGYTESVLVDGKQVVCTPGGQQGAVAALDKMSGKVLWQSKASTVSNSTGNPASCKPSK